MCAGDIKNPKGLLQNKENPFDPLLSIPSPKSNILMRGLFILIIKAMKIRILLISELV